MPKATLVSRKGTRTADIPSGDKLYSALVGTGFCAPCGGHGVCGGCKIRLLAGELTPPDETERKKLGDELKNGFRLACRCCALTDIVLELPETGGKAQIAENGASEVITTDGEAGLGIAVDIGTTTIAVFLLSLASGKTLAQCSALNAQRPYGADVVTRCGYALEHGGKTLKELIQTQLSDMIFSLCESINASISDIKRAAIAGNPAMTHIFAGLSVDGIARAPYSPARKSGFVLNSEYCPAALKNAEVFVLPAVSGFVGADTIAAVMASGMDERDELALIVDIGTNGEIALGSKNGLLACSAAAGPAFEGGKIACGVGGIEGAIDHVWVENGALCCSAIGNKKAVGLCGSGLIDCVDALLTLNLLDETGLLECERVELENGVYVCRRDIREVQLAKSALRSGIELLLLRRGVSAANVSRVYIAGGFGTFISFESACGIGLFPPELLPKMTGLGNAAGTGARLSVCSAAYRQRAQRLSDSISYLELANAPEFSNMFMDYMLFE